MPFPKEFHITDDRKPHVHPDRWKWDSAITYIGMEYNDYQLRKSGYRDNPEKYYRQYRFAMNSKTKDDIDIEARAGGYGIAYVNDREGLTVGIYGIEIRVDDNLPDGRVILIHGDSCASFDWRGRERWNNGEMIGYTFD
jgi:hypothetical protein